MIPAYFLVQPSRQFFKLPCLALSGRLLVLSDITLHLPGFV